MKPTNLLQSPSFFKGVARVVDLFGKLDSYRYSDNPDEELLKRDWEIVGEDLQDGINNYGKKLSCQTC